jgi:tRNA(Ile)-lysidine synthase
MLMTHDERDYFEELPCRVAESAAQQGLFVGAERILVGFSGGVDSTALLLILLKSDLEVQAVHFNHGLRGEAAAADAVWCEGFCRQRGIPFKGECLDVPAHRRPGEGLEEAARRCRLEAWQRLAEPGTVVALGHHGDDCVEELLLRLARGANASGLVGLRPERRLGGVRFVRPLLAWRRADLQAYLRGQGVTDCREDASNQDTSLRRNAVRHEWLPQMRLTLGGDGGLFRSLAALRDDADYLDMAAAAAVKDLPATCAVRNLHPALLPRVMRLWLSEQLGREVILRHEAVARLREVLARELTSACEVPLGDGVVVVVDSQRLRLPQLKSKLRERVWQWTREPELRLPETGGRLRATLVEMPVDRAPAEAGCECFAVDKMPATVIVRSRRPGDRMVPFGRRSSKKLQDILVDAKTPCEERDGIPVVEADGHIIWVAGVRRAEFGRLAGPVPALCLNYTPGGNPDQEGDDESAEN